MADLNPQAEQMTHESMVRNLHAQAEAIWPQERRLLEGYGIAAGAQVLDVGCGTGEITHRLAQLYPDAALVGVDVHPEHLERARRLCAPHGSRVRFERGDAYELQFAGRSFDLVLCRHLLQAIPHPERVVHELVRVSRPGGRVHVVAEDYGMMHFHPVARDTDRFWQAGPIRFAELTGTDLRVGRKAFTLASRAGLRDVTVDYVTIDTCRVPREVFAAIWTAWRDGYTDAIARATALSRADVLASFDTMLAAIRDPEGYGVWHLPVISGLAPPG